MHRIGMSLRQERQQDKESVHNRKEYTGKGQSQKKTATVADTVECVMISTVNCTVFKSSENKAKQKG